MKSGLSFLRRLVLTGRISKYLWWPQCSLPGI